MLSKVISLDHLAGNFWRLRLVKPSGFVFQAGQYISLKVHPDGHRRTYSPTSPPSSAHLDLLADVSPMGLGSKFILSLRPGAPINFLGPFGSFVIPDSLFLIRKIFLAGGSGIAPYLSMQASPVLWSLQHKSDTFSLKIPHQIFYTRNRLTKCLSEYPDLRKYHIYLCGSPNYVTSLTKLLLSLGVIPTHLHTEKFV